MFPKKTLIRSKVYTYVLEIYIHLVIDLATDEDVKIAILRKMLRLEYIGGRHTSMKNLPKGFPKSDRNRVIKIAQRMIKEGYFIVKPKRDSMHVSLDPKILRWIKQEIESYSENFRTV